MNTITYVDARMKWHDEEDHLEPRDVVIGIGKDINWEDDPDLDERVFYYVGTIDEFKALHNRSNYDQEFYLVGNLCKCKDCDILEEQKNPYCEECTEHNCKENN